MRSRLLMSAAVLAAGLAVASAQNAPGAGQEHTRNQARSQHHRSPAAASRKAERPLQTRAMGFGFQDGMEKGGSERGMAARVKSTTSTRRYGARNDLHQPAKHNDASVLPPRGQRDRGDRSMRDRAMGQGHLQPEQDRLRRRQQAAPLVNERGQDLALSKTLRRVADQRTARADNRDARGDQNLHGGRHQTRAALHREHHRDAARNANAGQEQVRRAQTALNQQGFNVGDPDGKLGKRTKSALIAFQKQRGFRTTGKVDHTTLHALVAGGAAAPGGSMGSNQGSTPSNPAPAPQPNPVPAPTQTGPQDVPPATAERSDAAPAPVAPPQPADGEASPGPEGQQMPDTGAMGRVPASSPQEDYKDETAPPADGDQR